MSNTRNKSRFMGFVNSTVKHYNYYRLTRAYFNSGAEGIIVMKRTAVFFICVVFCFYLNGIIARGAPPELFGLDLSSGVIYGDMCEYAMSIPGDWLEYVAAEREQLLPGSRTVEQLNFYFCPKNSNPIILSNIFIFETRYSSEIGSYKRILETDEYDFRTYVSAAEPELGSAGERIMYNHIVGRLGDVNFVSELFKFPEGKGPVVKEKLYVNGKPAEGSVIYKNSQPFVPLRAACEAMGYRVAWRGDDASVVIEKEGFEFVLYTSGKQNYGAVRVENSFYVPALFFIQVLKSNFETDKRGNVYITEANP